MKVLATRLIPPLVQKRLDSLKGVVMHQWKSMEEPMPRKELLQNVKDCHGILCLLTDKMDAELIDAAKELKVISTMSVGVDHIDLKKCHERGIVVKSTPGVLTDCTADLAITLLLTTLRKVAQSIQIVKTKDAWGPWSPLQFCGTSLSGKTVGIFGMGQIGQAIAERLVPFKPREILYTTGSGKAKDTGISITKFVAFEELLRRSDIIIISCSLNDKTREAFNMNVFKAMKPTSVLINVARGPVINHDDLVVALRDNYINLVGLDVTVPEPISHMHPLVTEFANRVTIFPHIGSATVETRQAMANMAVDNLVQELGI